MKNSKKTLKRASKKPNETKTPPIWKSLFVSVGILTLLVVPACKGKIPKWDGHLWAGDSANGAIARAQEGVIIPCRDPAFDQFVCMTYADFESFVNTYIKGCKRWHSSEMMDAYDAWLEFKKLQEGPR